MTIFGSGRGKVFPSQRAGSLLNPLRRLIQSPTRMVRRMGLALTDRVLEIGSGPGYFSRAVATAVPHGSLVLFDIQKAMLELARKRWSDLANIEFTQGDASSLPDRDRCIAEAARVLVRNCNITFAESRRDSGFIPINKLKALAEKHSLEFSERRGFGWAYTARFRKT